MKQIIAAVLVMLTLVGCTEEESLVESDKYYQEELRAYNDVFNEIADTTFYYKKLREQNAEQAVFFLYKNLEAIDNSGKEEEPLEEFVTVALEERPHYITRLEDFPKYRFTPAAEEKLQQPIRLDLQEGEECMYKWFTLSRVLFNSKFTEDILYYRKWSGDMASDGGTLRITKVKGKWVVPEKILAPVA
ncbi:hypothetical protein [Pontibacter mangrovi]|uniref:Lipoprotein n=1 Tax=Pontibacter mangrovi TaxID=2589816 RepID=A0A501W0F6_9BACT|nr:hypothetical protein [Pontibacter mangrovi]TPE42095.1 hypothetical protein FJM65_18585 [Pontibacter mangrovi]